MSDASLDASRPLLPLGIAAMVLAAACWGSAIVLTKDLLTVWPPVPLLAVQLAAGTAFLAACRGRLPGWSSVRRAGLAPALLLGCLEPGLAGIFEIAGLQRTTAARASVLGLTEPIFVCALAWLVLGERLCARVALGVTVAVLGLLMVGLVELVRGTGPGDLVGDTLVLAAAALCAASLIACSRLLRQLDPLSLALVLQGAALGFVLLLLLVATGLGQAQLPTGPGAVGTWLAAAWSGVLHFGLAWWLFLSGLRATGSVLAGVVTLLVPVFGVGGAVLALGERPALTELLGCAFVVAGVVIVVRAQRH